jgi:LacI family transcriptional regulator, gluconate utilization system Gnt-I transcriptional repressor
LMVGASGFSAADEESQVRGFLARRVDAFYLTGTSHSQATIKLLKAAGVPVVEGGNIPQTPIDMVVGVSNVDAAACVVEYLVRTYGPNVGFVGGSPVDNDRMRDRRAGYARALRKLGARPSPDLAIEGPISMESGRLAVSALLARLHPPRAIFCATDVIAAGAVLECVRRKIDVPGRLAIAGYDDLEIARELAPALTTVRVPRYEIGTLSAQLMHARLSGVRPAKRVHELEFELVLRQSA